jgi:hypothetical protein
LFLFVIKGEQSSESDQRWLVDEIKAGFMPGFMLFSKNRLLLLLKSIFTGGGCEKLVPRYLKIVTLSKLYTPQRVTPWHPYELEQSS